MEATAFSSGKLQEPAVFPMEKILQESILFDRKIDRMFYNRETRYAFCQKDNISTNGGKYD
jgi:hypothetical protein